MKKERDIQMMRTWTYGDDKDDPENEDRIIHEKGSQNSKLPRSLSSTSDMEG